MSLARGGFARHHPSKSCTPFKAAPRSQFVGTQPVFRQQYYRATNNLGLNSQRRLLSLPKLPLSPMSEETDVLSVNKVSSAIEKLVTDWRMLSTVKSPAETKYPNFSAGARTIIDESVSLLQNLENSSWYRADNPFAVDELEKIKTEFQKHKATMSKKELEVVEPLITKAEFVYHLWDRIYFAFNILSDMYVRYHNQGEVVDESAAMKEIYEEYKDLMDILEQSKSKISWVKPREFTQEDIDKFLNDKEKELLKEGDDEVLAKVRYHLQLNSFNEYELVERRVRELLVRLDYFRGQSGISYKGMDLDVFK